MRIIVRVSAYAALFVLMFCIDARHLARTVSAQSIPNQVDDHSGSLFGPSPFDDPAFRKRRMKALNEQRQKQLESDSQKLLKLTAEFNKEIVSESFKGPTAKQVQQLNRIEKLAKSVREKMTETFGDSGPLFRDPLMRPFP
ncbi:MAG TPA: hypothetical protein VG844_06400 [Terracidiphilus sp.]|nr:hypothetical protein [Terracidiphilus sp.]